jgi:hypothetical protein
MSRRPLRIPKLPLYCLFQASWGDKIAAKLRPLHYQNIKDLGLSTVLIFTSKDHREDLTSIMQATSMHA